MYFVLMEICVYFFSSISQADCILLVGLDEKGPSESMGQVNIVC